MVFEHQNYRTFLKSALAHRAKASEGYSLRGFAEKIQVSNSFLSEVLSSKKKLSVELAFKIAVKLDLTQAETQYFCLMVQLEQEKDPVFREEILSRLSALNPRQETRDLSIDVFKVISDWYHLAILELSYLPAFKIEPAYLAKKLKIPKVDAELAIERLMRLELLKKDARGIYRKADDYLLAESSVPQKAFKNYHRQLLEKLVQALDEQAPDQRISASDVLAFDSKYLSQVNRLSQEFSRAVMKLSDKSKVKNSVYALSVHFFELTERARSL